MPGQLVAGAAENAGAYMEWKEAVLEKVQPLLGTEVIIKFKKEPIKWIVIAETTTELVKENRDSLGVQDFNFDE